MENVFDFIQPIIAVLDSINIYYSVVVVLFSSWLIKVIQGETTLQKQMIVFGVAFVAGCFFWIAGWITGKELVLSFTVSVALYEYVLKHIMRAIGKYKEDKE